MSETTDPQGGGAPSTNGAPEPAAPTTQAPAPATTGAATEAARTEATTTDTPGEPEPKPSRTDRRIAALSARLSAGEQERARLAGELDAYRARANPEPARPITPEDIPRIVEERVAVELAQRQTRDRVEAFHAAGRAAYGDWQDRCQSLMQMGADVPFSQMLVELPDGAKIAAALADDPEELEKIVAISSERGRAIALGRFSAAMEGRPPPASRAISKAPPPIRPLNSGGAKVEFDPTRATTAQLVEHYSREAMAKRGIA